MQEIVKTIPLTRMTIADVGCGTGHFAGYFADKANEIYLVDPSQNMLDTAREFLCSQTNVTVHQVLSHAEEMVGALPKEFCDLAISRLALHHFTDPKAAIQSMIRILKPGGLIIITDLQGDSDDYLDELNHSIELLHDPTHRKSYTPEELAGWMKDQNIYIESIKTNRREAENGISIEDWCKITEVTTANQINQILSKLSEEQLSQLGYSKRVREYRNHIKTFFIIGRKCQ